jgi:hypothetical protein
VAVAGSQVQVARGKAALVANLSLKQSLTYRYTAASTALRIVKSSATGPLPLVDLASPALAGAGSGAGPAGATGGPPAGTKATSASAQYSAALPPLALPSTAAACAPDAALCCTSRRSPSVFAPRTYGYRPISSYKVCCPISLASIATHASSHSAVAGVQSLLADVGRHTVAYQAAHAARCGREPHEVCWFLQLPYRTAEDTAACPLSFSTQLGSAACVASFMLFFNVASLHALLLTAEEELLQNTAHGLGACPI